MGAGNRQNKGFEQGIDRRFDPCQALLNQRQLLLALAQENRR
jgi:hypothetical protein